MALISVRVDHYHHVPQPPEIPASIEERLDQLMTTQTQLAEQLAALAAQADKARAEVVARIAALEEALANSGEVSPEVMAAFDALKVAVQATDDIVPDAPPV